MQHPLDLDVLRDAVANKDVTLIMSVANRMIDNLEECKATNTDTRDLEAGGRTLHYIGSITGFYREAVNNYYIMRAPSYGELCRILDEADIFPYEQCQHSYDYCGNWYKEGYSVFETHYSSGTYVVQSNYNRNIDFGVRVKSRNTGS